MSEHQQLLDRITAAARGGEDVVALLRAERAHLSVCAECRRGVARLTALALGSQQALLLEQEWLEENARLTEPPVYPKFNLSFLVPPLWQWAEPANQTLRRLADGLQLRVRVLRKTAEAHIEGLAQGFSLQPALVAVPALRGSHRAASRPLELPDHEQNLLVRLSVQAAGSGRSHLQVEVRQIEPDLPLDPSQISLKSAQGAETGFTRQGLLAFQALEAGDYTLEIRPKGLPVWRFDLSIESS